MDEKTIKVRQCSKMSAFEVFDSLLEFDESLAVVNMDRLHLTDMKMAQILFSKLDALTETINHLSKPLGSHLFIRRISISPTKKFQLWVIRDKVVIFTETSIWLAFESWLFLEGELSINENIVWDEEKLIVSMTLFYIVHDKYEALDVSFLNCAADG